MPEAILGLCAAVQGVRQRHEANPGVLERASDYGNVYTGKRGLMVVDVVASRQRKYQTAVLDRLLPLYEATAKDLTLRSLSAQEPTWLKMRTRETATMQELANVLVDYMKAEGLTDEDEGCRAWATIAAPDVVAGTANPWRDRVLAVHGIGPALTEYLRMRCGADSLKVDVRVKKALAVLGIPTHLFTDDGLLWVCQQIAQESGLRLIELDQLLWHVNLETA